MVIYRYYTHVCPVAQFPLLERPFLIPPKSLNQVPNIHVRYECRYIFTILVCMLVLVCMDRNMKASIKSYIIPMQKSR